MAPKFRATPIATAELWVNFPISVIFDPPIDIYIDPVNGNDANDGLTPLTAKQSWFNTYDIAPLLPPKQVIYHLMPGAHDNMPISLFGGNITAVGTASISHFPLTTPFAFSAANRTMTFFPSPAWGIDEHKGRLLYIPFFDMDPVYGRAQASYPIVSNTADTLTLAMQNLPGFGTWPVEIVTPAATCQPPMWFGSQSNLFNFSLDMSLTGSSLYNGSGTFTGCIINGAGGGVNSSVHSNATGTVLTGFNGFETQQYTRLNSVFFDSAANMAILGWMNIRESDIRDCFFDGKGSTGCFVYASEGGTRFDGKTTFKGLSMSMNPGSFLIINGDIHINDSPNDGLQIHGGHLQIQGPTGLGGTGNANFGVRVLDGAFISGGTNATITGASGDFTQDNGVTPLAWAADVPITNLVYLSRVGA